MTNYQSAVKRIQRTNDRQSLFKFSRFYDTLCNYGLLTEKELQKLKDQIMDRMAELKVSR